MGIKAFNTFLKKQGAALQVQRFRTYLTKILEGFAVNHEIRVYIETYVLPLNDVEAMVQILKTLVEPLQRLNTAQSNELAHLISTEVQEVANGDPLRKRIPLSQFCGQRIAIDANNWMFMHISVAHRRTVHATNFGSEEVDRGLTIHTWLTKLLDDILLYLNYGVTPIFVFDGEYPEEKKLTKDKRGEKKSLLRERITEIKGALEEADILERNEALVSEYKKLLSQDTYVSREEVDLMKRVLRGLGIPWLQAKCEAEKLATTLAIEGKVAAVFSNDTDNLTHGCPCLATGFEGHNLVCISVTDVLDLLKISFSTFVDLCIMAGCDYNENIKNLGIGKAYNLLREYHRIDYLPPKYDTTCLNYQRCRELFAYTNSTELIADGHLDLQKEQLEKGHEVLAEVKLSHYLYKLQPHYSCWSMATDVPPRTPYKPKLVIVVD